MGVDDFELLTMIGKGAFGEVCFNVTSDDVCFTRDRSFKFQSCFFKSSVVESPSPNITCSCTFALLI